MRVVPVVEDDPDIVETTCFLLEDAGYEALPATGVDQALRVAETREDIDVIFTDVNLRAETNGIELARLLRARVRLASIVIVSGDLGWAETPLDEDMRFLAKPYGRDKLLAAVNDAYSRRHHH